MDAGLVVLLGVAVVIGVVIFLVLRDERSRKRKHQSVKDFVNMAAEFKGRSPSPIITKTYTGTPDQVRKRFDDDVRALALVDYFPTSQAWAPDGKLTVAYELRATDPEKTCPMCAERIKEAALVCRFCGHKFDDVIRL